jgi:hypothetical protein
VVVGAKVDKKKRKPDPLLVVLSRRIGPTRAMRVCSFVISWGYVYEKLGRAPTSVEEYAELASASIPTAYRDQRLFREAFPGESTPSRIWESLHGKIDTADPAAAARLGTISAAKVGISDP